MRLWPLAFVLLIVGCSSPPDPWAAARPGQPKVLAAFPPLYCFAANVAGDKAEVLCLLTGTGPHDYDATVADARKVVGSDLFLANGLELDNAFCEKLKHLARGTKSKLVLVGDEVPKNLLLPMPQHEGHIHEGEHDPHVWLGLKPAAAMVQAIAKEVSLKDPANKADYEKNADAYVSKLNQLDAYGREKFKNKASKTLITMHESLGYFAKTFGLDLVNSIQPQPGVEADAKQLSRLVDECKARGVRVIAVEPQYRRGQADTLAKALKERGLEVTVVEIDPMETAAPGPDGNPSRDLYLDRMRKNIDALANAFPSSVNDAEIKK